MIQNTWKPINHLAIHRQANIFKQFDLMLFNYQRHILIVTNYYTFIHICEIELLYFFFSDILWVTARPTNVTDSDGNSTITETPETTDVESTTPMTSPTTDNPVSTLSPNPFTPTVSIQPKNCRYVGFRTSPRRRRRFNRWCRWNCNRGYCPPSLCRCDSKATGSIMCHPIGIFRRMVGMSDWCNNNCKRQYCPRNMCKCKRVWDLNAIICFQLIWNLRYKFYCLVSNVVKFEISTLSFRFNSNVRYSISMFSVLHTSIYVLYFYIYFSLSF